MANVAGTKGQQQSQPHRRMLPALPFLWRTGTEFIRCLGHPPALATPGGASMPNFPSSSSFSCCQCLSPPQAGEVRNLPRAGCFPEEERERRLSDSKTVLPGTFPALQNPLPSDADPQALSLLLWGLWDQACL